MKTTPKATAAASTPFPWSQLLGVRTFGLTNGYSARSFCSVLVDGAAQSSGDLPPSPPGDGDQPTAQPQRDERDPGPGSDQEGAELPPVAREAQPVMVRELQLQHAPVKQVPDGARAAGPQAIVNPAVQEIARQMLRSVSVQRLGGRTDLRLQIETRRVPSLGLNLRLEGGKLRTRFNVPDRAGQDLLRSMAPELEAALQVRGLQVDEIRVECEEAPMERAPRGGDQGERRRQGERDQPGGEGRRRRGARRASRSVTDYIK